MSSPLHGGPGQQSGPEPPSSQTAALRVGHQQAARLLGDAIAQVQRVIVGQEHMVEQLMVALLAGGHCLLEGVPGVAKTLAVRSFATVVGGDFARIQFTPDLVPSDIVGTRIYKASQEGFDVELGPVFVNFVLADEINRAPAKVQSAMLELMAEKQVSIGGHTYPAPQPFIVIATQNPIESEGVYPLPEAQRDRFLLKVDVPYPRGNEEFEILRRMSVDPPSSRPVLNPDAILRLQRQASEVFVHNLVAEYIVRLVLATRTPAEFNMPDLTPVIQIGCSPRATLGLVAAARALALIHGRDYVLPTDVQAVARDVMSHRLVLGFDAVADNITPAQVIERIVAMVPPPTPVWNAQASQAQPGPAPMGQPQPQDTTHLPRSANRCSPTSTEPPCRTHLRCPAKSRLAPPPQEFGAVSSVVGAPTRSTIPLNKLAPEAALRRLELTIVRRLEGYLHGDHLGLLPGPGSETNEARLYRAGEDDVRKIDWAVTARTTVPYVRDTISDRELEVWGLLDVTPSMNWGTEGVTKRDLGIAAIATIGFLSQKMGDRFGGYLMRPDSLGRLEAGSGRSALYGLLRKLLTEPFVADHATGEMTLAKAVEQLSRTQRRRGLRVVVSDFLTPGDHELDPNVAPEWERAMRRLSVKNQVLAIEVVDRREIEFPDVGDMLIRDPETDFERYVNTADPDARRRMDAASAAQRERIRIALRRAGVGHIQLRTDRDWVQDIARFVLAYRRVASMLHAPPQGVAK